MSYATLHPAQQADPRARRVRPALAAAIAYVGAWVAGLPLAPTAPSWTEAAAVHEYYLEHAVPVLAQATLVHGVAGIALALLAVRLGAASATAVDRWGVVVAGCAAALVSLAQAGIALVATHDPAASAAATSADLRHLIDLADTLKLVLLAVFVAAATSAASRSRRLPTWVRWVSWSLVVLLPAGGAAFVMEAGPLTALLTVSLPLLLVWVGAMGYVVRGGVR